MAMRYIQFVRQHDSMQCGITCLQMICRYFGREYSLDSLSKICFATTEGVSMLGINEAAKILGLQTVSARATTEELSEVPLPCILYWNQNHFVVLYKVKNGKKFYIADPGKGKIPYNLEEFKRHWISTNSNGEDKGIAMFFETTPAFFTYQMEGGDAEGATFLQVSFWIFQDIPQAVLLDCLGTACGQCLAVGVAVSYPVHRGCRHQEPRHRVHLAHSLGAVDAHRQPNGDRLCSPLVFAPHLHAHQYLLGERFFHQTSETPDVVLRHQTDG